MKILCCNGIHAINNGNDFLHNRNNPMKLLRFLTLAVCVFTSQRAFSQNVISDGQHELVLKIKGGYTQCIATAIYVINGKQEGEKMEKFRASYDAEGNLLEYQDSDGYAISFTYNSSGDAIESKEFTSKKAKEANTTKYIYNDKHQAVNVLEISASGDTSEIIHTYDPAGKRVSSITKFFFGKNDTTYYVYNTAGHLIADSSRGSRRRHVVDERGNEIELTSENSCGSVTMRSEYRYDTKGAIVEVTKRFIEKQKDLEMMKVVTTFDALGNKSKEDFFMGKIKGLEDMPELSAGNARTEFVYSK